MMKTVLVILALLFVFAQGFSYSAKTFDTKQQTDALKFWTPEMMKKAVPMETLLAPKQFEKYFKDEKVKFEPDTDFVKPDTKYQEKPYSAAGKVYFLFEGRPASCSGSSSGNNVVLTAAHCVYMQGNYHTQWVFVPQYNSGSRPHGIFSGKEVIIFEEWKNQDMGRDVAFVVTSKQNGKSLEEVVGKIQIGTCDVNDDVLALGYPGPDYGAERMVQTVSKIVRRFPFSPWTPAPIQIRSKQGPGSSGGPWFSHSKDSNTNIACSVNSFGLRFTYFVFGPFFDKDVLDMHKVAVARE
jgi:V8-like Glu-specific endopeptidase